MAGGCWQHLHKVQMNDKRSREQKHAESLSSAVLKTTCCSHHSGTVVCSKTNDVTKRDCMSVQQFLNSCKQAKTSPILHLNYLTITCLAENQLLSLFLCHRIAQQLPTSDSWRHQYSHQQ